MLLSDEEVQTRLESPLNLLNRLRKATTPAAIPSLPPTSKDLDLNVEEKLAVGKLKENAAAIMALSLAELKQRISDIQKPEKLAQIAAEMNKVVISRQDEGKNPPAQIIVYAPSVVNETHFEELVLKDDQV